MGSIFELVEGDNWDVSVSDDEDFLSDACEEGERVKAQVAVGREMGAGEPCAAPAVSAVGDCVLAIDNLGKVQCNNPLYHLLPSEVMLAIAALLPPRTALRISQASRPFAVVAPVARALWRSSAVGLQYEFGRWALHRALYVWFYVFAMGLDEEGGIAD